jgi:hypothetical protein
MELNKLEKFQESDFLEHYLSETGFLGLGREYFEELQGDANETDHLGGDYDKPIPPEMSDLARLHFLISHLKPVCYLEFGSGLSTAVAASAVSILRETHLEWAQQNLRHDSPFHIYSIDESEAWLERTKSLVPEASRNYVTLMSSGVLVEHYNFVPVTFYEQLPNVAPDFIYLDGPSQFATDEDLAGLSFSERCRFPVAADILRFEYFMEPGSVILVDGRTTNARFLKNNLQRNWSYLESEKADVSYFSLDEPPIGSLNKDKLSFLRGV